MRIKEERPVAWRVANARSVLGGALIACADTDTEASAAARTAKLAKAERLLLDGYEGLHGSPDPPASVLAQFTREALQRLIRLHETWDKLAPETGQAAQVAKWRAQLAAFDQLIAR